MSTDKPEDNLVRLVVGDLPNVAVMLRKLADDIDKGEYGEVRGAAVVLDAWAYPIFGFGKADGPTFHTLCHMGMDRIIDQWVKTNGGA